MNSPEQHLAITVKAEHGGERLDKFLSHEVENLSRSRLKTLIGEGRLRCGEQTITDPARPVKPGESFILTLPKPENPEPRAEDIPLTIAYEDDDLIVVDKPPGMVVHPAPGNHGGTLVNALIAHCGSSLSGIGGVRRPGIVHRIDKDTSGLLVIAKNDRAHAGLSELFARHDITRIYLALCWGIPVQLRGYIDAPIARHPVHRKKMAVRAHGKHAVTRYQRLQSWHDAISLIGCMLETGRTHQIRVHMTHNGHPLIGDPVYGRPRRGLRQNLPETARIAVDAFPRQALHAALLGFRHPISGNYLEFTAPPPADFAALMEKLSGERLETTKINHQLNKVLASLHPDPGEKNA